VRAYHHTYGLPVLTTNCSNNYGPCQFPEKLIPLMILNALGQAAAGLRRRIAGARLAARAGPRGRHQHGAGPGPAGEVYNIGGSSERTNLQVVQAICDALDRRRPDAAGGTRRRLIEHVADRPGHDRRYAIDCSKLTRTLGWKPSVAFESGLEQTVDWYLANPDWVQRVRDGSYQGERLGLGAA
jgi:dTDP-glucose 4,6-dehydratase